MEYFLVVIKRDENVFLSVFSLRRCKKRDNLSSNENCRKWRTGFDGSKKGIHCRELCSDNRNFILAIVNELNFHNLLLSWFYNNCTRTSAAKNYSLCLWFWEDFRKRAARRALKHKIERGWNCLRTIWKDFKL